MVAMFLYERSDILQSLEAAPLHQTLFASPSRQNDHVFLEVMCMDGHIVPLLRCPAPA